MSIFVLNPKHQHLKQHAMPVEKAVPQAKPLHAVTKKAQERRRFFSQKEWIILGSSFLFFILALMLLISMKASLAQEEYDMRQIEQQTLEVKSDKTHAEQEINELSNYDRVMKIAEENGLTMNEDNIRNVKK
ncbi:MAG: cell division protein FtsL [Aerococcus sp.]|nr:cell division protein FtsL [Aerococcus sp.]